ncbi:hypothetical protein diail_9278, partial [Diaporthe ilicicola]
MTETAGLSPDEAAAAARAAEQARLRKERREAKIKAGGSARLNRITGLGGGIQRDPIPSNPPSTASSPAPASAAQPQAGPEQQHGDPDEVDISEHYYEPQKTNRIPSPSPAARGGDPSNVSEDQLRQMMLGFDRSATPGANGPPPANPLFDPAMFGGANGEEDPMMKMLSQMLGPGAVPPNFGQSGPGGRGSNPFAGGNPFGGGMQQQQQQQAAPFDPYAAFWRIVHFLLAAGLGLYIAQLSDFTGTKIQRERSAFADSTGQVDDTTRRYFFWIFATAETVLLTSRLLLDQGRAPPPGILWTILGFIPDGKMKGLVTTGLKYSRIFTT